MANHPTSNDAKRTFINFFIQLVNSKIFHIFLYFKHDQTTQREKETRK